MAFLNTNSIKSTLVKNMLKPFTKRRWLQKGVSLCISALALCCAHTIAWAAPTVDTTWANAGRLTFNMNGGTQSTGQQVLQVADGKLLVLGYCTSQATADYCVRRLNADGSNDTTFGTGGQGETVINLGGQDFPSVMEVGTDGKIVIGGNGVSGQLVRLLPNGLIDATFGNNGVATTGVPRIYSLRVRGDGKIVFTGECWVTAPRFCVGRANGNGAFDPSFNSGAPLQFTPAGTAAGKAAISRALAHAPNGAVYIGGGCEASTTATSHLQFCVAKVSPAGTLDPSFGASGVMNFAILGTYDQIESLALQSDGKLLAAGTCLDSSTGEQRLCIARYGNTGLDSTYGNGAGYVSIALGSTSVVYHARVQVQPDGKALMTGYCYSARMICLVRLNDDGTPDTAFSGGGIFYLPLANPATVPTQTTMWASGAAPVGRSGDKLIAFGHCGPQANTSAYAPCLVKVNIAPPAASVCSLDIDGDGRVGSTTDALLLARIALGITGNAVVAGGAANPAGERSTWPLIQDYLTRHCGMNLVP